MKKTLMLIAATAIVVAGCTKKTTNVTNNTIVMTEPKPAYIISGLHNLILTNGVSSSAAYMGIDVQYNDSVQQLVSLSLSPLPAGIAIDTTWVTTGYPTFSTTLQFFDTTAAGATPGTYPMVLTAKTDSGIKTYPFNIVVNPVLSCTNGVIGKYFTCFDCSGAVYADSVYNDPNVLNKIWFSNFNNSGNKIYGTISCSSMSVHIPSQTVGGVNYIGNGTVTVSHHIYLNMAQPGSSCSISMN